MHYGKEIHSTQIENPAPSKPLSDYEGHNVIFLDVDGVLNNSTTRDRIGNYTGLDDGKIELLAKLLTSLKADLVLCSSWKEKWFKNQKNQQDVFANILDERLGLYGLVIADRTIDEGRNRGEGILEWIRIHGPLEYYIILDDERFDYSRLGIGRHWVQTSYYGPKGGLGEHHIRYIQKHLELYRA